MARPRPPHRNPVTPADRALGRAQKFQPLVEREAFDIVDRLLALVAKPLGLIAGHILPQLGTKECRERDHGAIGATGFV